MSYPINEIFDGVADLLMVHGKHQPTTYNGYACRETKYVKYGGYDYEIVYVDDELQTISRIKEVSNGKN